MPTLRHGHHPDDADRRLPVVLRVPRLQGAAAAQDRRLLRVLLVRLGKVPPDAGGARLLRVVRLD